MAMTEYVEELLLKVKTDKTELEKIQKDFDNLKINELLSPEAKDELEKSFKEHEERLVKLKKLEKEITVIKKLGGKAAEEALDKLEEAYKLLKGEEDEATGKSAGAKKDFSTELKAGIQKGLVDAGKKAWEAIKGFAEDIYNNAIEMMRNIAKYSDTSKIFSEEAASLKLTFGLQGQEAYALQNALKDVGLGSVEDYLEKGWMLNQQQRDYLQEQITMYKRSYEQDKEVALLFQEFEVEWSQFKQELSVELIHFFMQNKTAIKNAINALIGLMKGALDFFSWFVGTFSKNSNRVEYERDKAASDIISSSIITNNSANNSKTISVSNTFNGVQTSDRTDLINAGNMTYQQIIDALQ